MILVCSFLVTVILSSTTNVHGKEAWSYVNVRPDAYMFWWLYYADLGEENYSKYPLIIWLQGGPGASSTGYGNFMEIGPLNLDLTPRNTTWTKKANLLFIDNPVGTGFSYVTNKSALCTNNTQIAQDLLMLMAAFFRKVPEFQNVPLYIFAESYGGKMAVSFGKALYKNIQSGKMKCKFKGVALGDSFISPLDTVATWGQYLYTTSLVDENGLKSISEAAKNVKAAIDNQSFSDATNLWADAQDLISSLTNSVNWYNILANEGPINSSAVSLPKNHSLYLMFQRHVGYFSDDALYKLMNGEIKKSLHIIPKNVTWGGQSADVFTALTGDFMRSVTEDVDYLLNRTDLSVNVYNAQLDLIVDTLGTLQWIYKLKWPGIPSFQQAARKPFVFPPNRTAGFVKSFKNFRLFWIMKSGHMVPQDAGLTALKMLDMILQ
uniref:Carboxypeptidase n=1 Tax=Centruroides hentzi TaxID=88313 RepID=A0A2I9LNU5_9SCOR